MRDIIKSRKALSSVFGVLLMFIIVVASGIMLFDFVISKIQFAKEIYGTQMANLLLRYFTINSTHITACIQNAGGILVKITSAYVNGIVSKIFGKTELPPLSTQEISILGNFVKGVTYTVKILTSLNTELSFKVSF